MQASVVEDLILSLTDSTKRDDIKYKDLREISENFEELSSNASYAPLLDSLIRAFIRILQETQPQFISENNTLQLRKLVLELLLRMSTSECIKNYSKAIQVLLLRITYIDNEENALIVIKILTDHIKAFRGQITGELTSFFLQWKNAYREMFRYASEERMFLSPDYFEANSRSIEDFVAMDALQTCFMTSVLSFKNVQQPQNLKYSLIPRAVQSVRVLAEMSVFLLFLIQSHRQHSYGELMELIPLFVRYINITVPKHLRLEKSYNKELVDEFHNSQVRALTFIAYTTRHSQLLELIGDNSMAIANGIKQLFDGLHNDVIHQRRDLLLAIKHFFQCENKSKFIGIIPRMLTDSLLIGTSFTSRDQLRNQAYTLLADILHHVRMSLPYKVLTHIYFTAIRNMHDPLLLPYVQTMYGKLMMNFIEPLMLYDKQGGDPARDILLCAIDAYVRKAAFLANHYLPLLREKYCVSNTSASLTTAGAASTIFLAASVNNLQSSSAALTVNSALERIGTSNTGNLKNFLIAEDTASLPNSQESSQAQKSSAEMSQSLEAKKQITSFTEPSTLKAAEQQQTSTESSLASSLTGEKQTSVLRLPATTETSSAKKTPTLTTESANQSWQDVSPLSLNDCKNMIRFIIQPIKMMVTALREVNTKIEKCNFPVHSEAKLLSKFFVHGLKCLDIFMIGSAVNNSYQKSMNASGIRSKEEKEAIDAFIGIYSNLESSIFYNIMNEHIEFFVNRISNNLVLQSICSTILIHHPAAPKIGGVLVKFLLKQLPEMGNNNEKSILYLKLFKLVFSAVSYAQVNPECENMLKPFLHEIVQESMQLALRSRESNNYFWLLRALFRSIGSGAHDLLYQQFLPLLPSILQQLNRLQNSSHRQSIHELFVELCLTVPVRLSSLLPYLPLLMDPLVCALYGSPTLVQQGLRTLELCVDNLQPEYFYDHMFPVRASLLQGLWQTVSTSDFQTSLSAFRILGKFGGSSRKVLLDARAIDFNISVNEINDSNSASLSILFSHTVSGNIDDVKPHVSPIIETMDVDVNLTTPPVKQLSSMEKEMNRKNAEKKIQFWVDISLQSLLEGAASVLRNSQNNDGMVNNVIGVNSMGYGGASNGLPRTQAFEIIKSVLLSSIYSKKLSKLEPKTLKKILKSGVENTRKMFLAGNYCRDFSQFFNQPTSLLEAKTRSLHATALIGLFFAVMNNDLKEESFPFFREVVRYITIHVIIHFGNVTESGNRRFLLNGVVLIDAITTTLGDSCKDFCHAVIAALKFIVDTAIAVFGSEKVCELPFFDYLVEQISFLCFRKEWYARIGGCTALRFITDNYPQFFVRKHAALFLNAFIEITSGLADEVSCGALDFASESMDMFLPICFPAEDLLDNNELHSRKEMIDLFLCRIIDHLDDSEVLLKKECHRILQSISQFTGQSVVQLLSTHQSSIAVIFAEKMKNFIKLSVDHQIGFISFFTFILELDGLEINVPYSLTSNFLHNLAIICDESQQNLLAPIKFPLGDCFQPIGNNDKRFSPIRRASIGAFVPWCLKKLNSAEGTEQSNEALVLPLVNNIFSLLLSNALSTCINEELRMESAFAVKKIVNSLSTSLGKNFVDVQVSQLFANLTKDENKLTPEFLKNLLFLSEISSLAQNNNKENIEPLSNGIQTIFERPESEVTIENVNCIIDIIKYFCRVHFQSFDVLKSCLSFFAKIDEKFRIKYNKEWMSVLLEFTSLHTQLEVVEFFIKQANSGDLSSFAISNFAIKFILNENSEKFCKIFKDGIDVLAGNLRAILEGKPMTAMEETVMEHLSATTPQNPLIQNVTRLLRMLKLFWALFEKGFLLFDQKFKLFTVTRELWNSDAFRSAFSIRVEFGEEENVSQPADLIEAAKYEVPVYCARILLSHLRSLLFDTSIEVDDITSIDLLYDLIFIFCYTYVSDFAFIRSFIDAELIPFVSLEWRRKAFKNVIDNLKSLEATRRSTYKTELCSDQLVRFMQFIVVPAFQFAFEKFHADLVVGSAPDQDQKGNENVMSVLISYIEMICTQNRDNVQPGGSNPNKSNRDNSHCMSDAMTIVMYQFCVLLVQNCPFHIHDMSRKQQQEGNRLRSFMLFGWPCLQANYSRDLTEKYAGHLLIANIIDKFAINRKIVLQVLNSLVMAHHQDHKDVVRKALDILIPAVPRRMDDGHIQLFTIIKKVILEESRSTMQVAVHCLNIVIRHHKVFYFVRHQLSHLLLNTLQRLLSSQYGFESRRLVIDVCDMFIKWEQERQRILGATDLAGGDVAPSMKTYNSQSNLADIAVAGVNQRKCSNTECPSTAQFSSTVAAAPELSSNVADSSPNSSTDPTASTNASKNGGALDELYRSMDKFTIDNVIMLLVKIATSTPEMMPGGMSNSSIEQMTKRCIMLLRISMKPNVFGNIISLKPQWFEKQLTLPNLEQLANEQASNHQLAQVHLTLDTFSHIIMYMPQQVVTDLFRPLQRLLTFCLNCSTHQIVRSTYTVIGKLMEKTNTSANGLIEFEMLNQSIAKYIHDSFSSYFNSLSSPNQLTFMPINLLRSIYAVEPSYLETVCLNPFLKMLQRLVRDYQSPASFYGQGQPQQGHIDPGQKFLSEVLCLCFELLCLRIPHLAFEPKRNIAQLILAPLMEKNPIEKVLEALIKITNEFVIDSSENAATNNRTHLGAGLLIRMCAFLETRILANPEFLRMFLESVLYFFESGRFLDVPDVTAKLSTAFYWGLSCSNHSLRSRCFTVLEKYFPTDIYQRMMHILSKHNWQSLGTYFWVTHLIHLLLLSNAPKTISASNLIEDENETDKVVQRVFLKNSLTFATFGESIFQQFEKCNETVLKVEEVEINVALGSASTLTNSLNSTIMSNVKSEEEEPMDIDIIEDDNGVAIPKSNNGDFRVINKKLTTENPQKENVSSSSFESYFHLLQMAAQDRCHETISSIVDFLHYDWRIAKNIFIKLFQSFWRQLNDSERAEVEAVAQPFLASVLMFPQRDSPLSVSSAFLEAFYTCQPPITLTPALLRYIGETHNCWHFVIQILEKEASKIRLSNDPILKSTQNHRFEKLEVLENLALLYSELNECDQFWMVWKRKGYFDKTAKCLSLYNQEEFSQSRDLFEKLLNQFNERLSRPPPNEFNSISPALYSEVQLWEKYWINSCKELNDWSTLAQFSNDKEIADCNLLMESAWHLNEWRLLSDCITQVDASADPKVVVKTTLYKSMLSIVDGDGNSKELIEKSLMDVNKFLIADWRKLPKVVSMSHVRLLMDAHFAHEVSEASSTLQSTSNGQSINLNNSVKHVMKSWRSRPLTQVDSLSSWINIFKWRFQHYNSIINEQQNNTFLLHSLAQSQLNLALSLRRSNQIEMALNELNTLHTMPSILPMDAQFKVYEQVKCLIKMANCNGNGNRLPLKKQSAQNLLHEALNVVESTHVQFLKKDQIARIMLTKGILLSKLDRREEAEQAFANAAMLEDSITGSSCSPVWKHWGRHLESIFLSNPIECNALNFGVQAIICFLECAKFASALKSRSYLSRVFWLIKMIAMCGAQSQQILEEALSANVQSISLINWLFWVNEIIADIRQRPFTNAMTELLCLLAEAHPQQVFYAIRTNLDTALINERIQETSNKLSTFAEWNTRFEISGSKLSSSKWATLCAVPLKPDTEQTLEFEKQCEKPEVVSSINGFKIENRNDLEWSKKLLCALDALFVCQPASIFCLNEIFNEFDNFVASPLELVLYQLRDLLNEFNDELFSNIADLTNAQFPKTLEEKTLKLKFFLSETITAIELGVSPKKEEDQTIIELLKLSVERLSISLNSETAKRLHNVSSTLRKCLAFTVEALRSQTENRQNLLRNSSKILSNFKNKMALIDIFTGPTSRVSSHSAQIAHFMPTFYTFARHTGVRRLILLRSLNGKIYSYFLEKVKSDPGSNYIFQLFAMLNTEFTKDRAVCQRLIQFAVPRVLYISAQSRITECCSMAGSSSQQFCSRNSMTDSSDLLSTNNFVNFIDIFDQTLQNYCCENSLTSDVDVNKYDWPKNSHSRTLEIVDFYYRRLIDQRFCHKTLLDIFNEISQSPLKNNNECRTRNETSSLNDNNRVLVPKNLLKKWLRAKYSHPTDFWAIKKNLSVAFALLGMVEYAFFLTPMNLNELFLDVSSSQLFFCGYRFDLSKKFCETPNGKVSIIELDANRPVAFRMSSNISHFLGLSIEGHVSGALISVARCLNNPSINFLIRPILWNVFHQASLEDTQNQSDSTTLESTKANVANPVKRAVDTIMNRIKHISQFESANSPTTGLLVSSQHSDNLCRMNPFWHPWF